MAGLGGQIAACQSRLQTLLKSGVDVLVSPPCVRRRPKTTLRPSFARFCCAWRCRSCAANRHGRCLSFQLPQFGSVVEPVTSPEGRARPIKPGMWAVYCCCLKWAQNRPGAHPSARAFPCPRTEVNGFPDAVAHGQWPGLMAGSLCQGLSPSRGLEATKGLAPVYGRHLPCRMEDRSARLQEASWATAAGLEKTPNPLH
jgi:hypothetical protein